MGVMEQNLRFILSKKQYQIENRQIRFPIYDDIAKSRYKEEILGIYKLLSGINYEFPLNLRKWDLEVDEIAVELDEYLHFNRYRALTLKSDIYNILKRFPLKEYSEYCIKYEGDCLDVGNWGGKWSNSSCEKQFGSPSSKGDLSGNGAPRWKQRAFYDFVKDISPLIIGVSVARISIWDTITLNDRKLFVKDILNENVVEAGTELYKLLRKRVHFTG
jgi:hypothetical protein